MRPRSLADFKGPFRGSGEELNYQSCPECGSTGWKVYVNPITGLWFCFAGNHQAGGRVQADDFTDEARRELLALTSGSLGRVPTQQWPEIELPPFMPVTPPAQAYLRRRGIGESTWGRLGIVEMRRSPRVLIPYRGPYGRVIYWTARSYTTWEAAVPKYMSAPGKHPLFMLPRWEAVSAAVVVEGPFDAIAVWRSTGVPAVALGGKSLSNHVEIDLRKLVRDRLIVMLDGDAEDAALQLCDQLMDQYTLHVVNVGEGKDPADLNGDELRYHTLQKR